MPRARRSRYAENYRLLLSLLAQERRAASVTQQELEKATGISQSMLSKMERGVVRIDLADLLDYLDGIGSEPLQFIEKYLAAAQTVGRTLAPRNAAARKRKIES